MDEAVGQVALTEMRQLVPVKPLKLEILHDRTGSDLSPVSPLHCLPTGFDGVQRKKKTCCFIFFTDGVEEFGQHFKMRKKI